jgi:hypothetical protein
MTDASLANVYEMFHKRSGPNDATNVCPALTNNERGRFAVALNPYTRIAPARQVSIGEAFKRVLHKLATLPDLTPAERQERLAILLEMAE